MHRDSPAGFDPYVSILFTGRNDAYGGDFVGRFLATLRFNHRELAARGIAHEFVLVEWAPVPGAPLLIDLVDEHGPASGALALRSIVVDPAYHEAVTLNPRIAYDEYVAKNVGLRRCRGEYVISTNCDIFFGRQILERLEARRLEPATVYRAPRWDLKPVTALERVDWAHLDDPANLVHPLRRLKPPLYSGGAGDFTALDRASFHRLGGFNEIYRLVRVGIDGNLIIHALSSGLSIAPIGGPIYHVSHAGSFRLMRESYIGREADAHYGDERWPADTVVYRNPPEWGLVNAPAREIGSRRTYLDFTWDAVPPLVNLAGVVLSAWRSPRR
jgi:hypothetical protein